MSLTLITPPAVEPISLDELRQQVQLGDDTSQDTLLTIYITAARQQAEQTMSRPLISQVWEQRLDAFPAAEMDLGQPSVLSITSVSYTDTTGAEQLLDASAYLLDAAAYPGGWLLPAAGTSWPATAAQVNAVRVRYTCGFGPAAEDVPAPIRAWLLLTAAALFAQREALDVSGKVAALPDRFVDRLLDPWRVY